MNYRRRQERDRAISGGQSVDRVVVPFTATDFTPFVQQLKQKNPDLLFVAWAGTTTAGDVPARSTRAGIFDSVDKVVLGLAERSTYTLYGAPASKLALVSSYLLRTRRRTRSTTGSSRKMKRRGQVPDLFTPDGFVAGQMIVRALQASTGDVGKNDLCVEG